MNIGRHEFSWFKCIYRHIAYLKRLDGKQIAHRIYLKFLSMISFAMNYYLVKKKFITF